MYYRIQKVYLLIEKKSHSRDVTLSLSLSFTRSVAASEDGGWFGTFTLLRLALLTPLD